MRNTRYNRTLPRLAASLVMLVSMMAGVLALSSTTASAQETDPYSHDTLNVLCRSPGHIEFYNVLWWGSDGARPVEVGDEVSVTAGGYHISFTVLVGYEGTSRTVEGGYFTYDPANDGLWIHLQTGAPSVPAGTATVTVNGEATHPVSRDYEAHSCATGDVSATLNPETPERGGHVRIGGEGCEAGEAVEVEARRQVSNGAYAIVDTATVTADAAGAFAAVLTLVEDPEEEYLDGFWVEAFCGGVDAANQDGRRVQVTGIMTEAPTTEPPETVPDERDDGGEAQVPTETTDVDTAAPARVELPDYTG